jgi:hypothetical protein
MGITWTVGLLAAYIFVFRSTVHRLDNTDILWGLFLGLPAPLICLFEEESESLGRLRPRNDLIEAVAEASSHSFETEMVNCFAGLYAWM